jgi:hypothetical protein
MEMCIRKVVDVLLNSQQYFSYIVVVSFIGGETGVAGLPRENHRLPKSQ